MGRLGPLTSQALGRSPYDDVVMGTGEGDPREPEKQYDEKGRLINPRTKQAIKDTIRAHNEVMLVIGVAEPDSSGITEAQAKLNREYHEYEADTGRTLLNVGRSLGILGIWGVHGTRQRVLLYKRYNHIPFWDLWKHECKTQSVAQIACTGLPAFFSMQGLRWLSSYNDWVKESKILQGAFACLRFHLHLFLTLQRLGLISSSRWVPDINFFIPFSESSPFLLPPPPRDTSAASLVSWTGQLAVNLSPYAAFYLCGRLWNTVHANAWPEIYKRLPRPVLRERPSFRPSHSVRNSQSWQQPVSESPTLGAADREIRHTQPPDADIPTLMALDGQGGPSMGMGSEGIPVEAIRRRGTFSSSRGGGEIDYGTDEEDAEMVNPTLISFDVDTSDSATEHHNTGGGMWSAELRPSAAAGDGHAQEPEGPNYIVNPLTRLPAMLGTDILTNFFSYLVCAPTDALALRGVARVFAQKRGLPVVDHMFDGNLLSNVAVRGVVNLVGLEVVRLLISGDVWGFITILSQWLHVTEEEWIDIHQKAGEENAAAVAAAQPES